MYHATADMNRRSTKGAARPSSAVRCGVWLAASLGALAGCADDGAATTVLRVSNWGSPAVEPSFMQVERELWAEFERRHPGVRVQIEQIPGPGQYAPKLMMMHLTGSTPDVVHLDASSAAVFMNNDVLRDLRPRLERDPDIAADQYFDAVLDVYRRDDALYAIPLDFTPMVLYYNKKLFDEAGVPYPQPGWTWDDFLHKARMLTKPPPPGKSLPAQYGFFFENIMPFWSPWLWSAGGDVLSPDGSRAAGFLDGPQSVGAVRFLVDLLRRHHVAPTLRESAIEGANPFLEGRAAMDLKGHWMLIDYRARGLDVGVVELPRIVDRPVTVIYAAGLAIMRKARQPDLAWEYIKYFTSKEVQIKRLASGLAISGNRSAAERFAGTETEDAFLRQIEHARPPWGARVESYPFVEELGNEMMRDLLNADQANVEQALRRTAKLIDAALAGE